MSEVLARTFQQRVKAWMMECFSMEVTRDVIERNHRFLEEALELVQSTGCTRSEAHQLVDYVFDRPVGEPSQEFGGTMVTLAALAGAHDEDLMTAAETELARVWKNIEKIRAKQAAKPKHSPLPEATELYLVWSHEHGLWWRANSSGYSRTLEGAGRYSKAEALEICRGARNGYSTNSVPSEIPVPEDDMLACAR